MSDIRELGTVLSIWAHPDDEAIRLDDAQKVPHLPAQDTGKHCLLLMSNIAAMVA